MGTKSGSLCDQIIGRIENKLSPSLYPPNVTWLTLYIRWCNTHSDVPGSYYTSSRSLHTAVEVNPLERRQLKRCSAFLSFVPRITTALQSLNILFQRSRKWSILPRDAKYMILRAFILSPTAEWHGLLYIARHEIIMSRVLFGTATGDIVRRAYQQQVCSLLNKSYTMAFVFYYLNTEIHVGQRERTEYIVLFNTENTEVTYCNNIEEPRAAVR